MNSIILTGTDSATEIFRMISNYISPHWIVSDPKDRKHFLLKGDIFVSFYLEDIKPQSVLLINSDIRPENYPCLMHTHPVITYGCNPKSTVTASSICEEKIMCCVQRSLILDGFYPVLPQEFSVLKQGSSISSLLGAICVLLLSFGESVFF